MSLEWFLIILKRRYKIVFISLIAGGIISFTLIHSTPKLYEASFSLQFQQEEVPDNIEKLRALIASPQPNIKAQLEVLTSSLVLEKTLRKINAIPEMASAGQVEDMVKDFQKSIIVSHSADTNIAYVRVSKRDKQLAYTLAKNLLQTYIETERNLRISKHEESKSRLLQIQIDVKKKMEDLTKSVELYRKVKDIEDKITKLKARHADLLSQLEQELSNLQKRKDDLLKDYTEIWPEVQDVNRKIQIMQALINGEDIHIEDAYLLTYVPMSKQLKKLKEEIDEEFDKFDKAVLEAWRKENRFENIEQLNSEIATLKELDASLVREINKIQTTIDTTPSNVVVLKEPVEPISPITPDLSKTIVIGGIITLILTISLIYLAEYFDPSLRTAEELQHYTNQDVLGIIPYITTDHVEPGVPPVVYRDDILARRYADSFRILKTNILFTLPRIPNPAIVVTSSIPSEGKSTVALNLASAFAEDDRKTVLVCCDLRRPSLHRCFNAHLKLGIVDILQDNNIKWQDCLLHTFIKNLDFIPAGQPTSKSSSLFAKPAFTEILAQLKNQYEVIVIDSPSALLIPDSLIISSNVDLVIICYAIAKTDRKTVRQAVNVLKRIKNNNGIGLVANFIDTESYYKKYYKTYYSDHSSR